jgi:multidrug efflux pump subunit AcrA (membrane-fusion protein)
MKATCVVYILLIICSFSCKKKKDNSILTYKLSRADYIERIEVGGTVQSVTTTPVMPPRTSYSQLTVVRLAQDGSYVKTGDTLFVLTVPELESAHRDVILSIKNLEADLKRTEADYNLSKALHEAQMATMEAQLKISSLDSLQMKYATEVNRKLIDLEIKKTVIEKQKLERKLASSKMAAETDISQKKLRIAQEKMKEQTLADQLSSLILIANRDGMVMRVESPRITVMSSSGGSGTYGGPIREGSVLMILTTPVLQFPDLSRMQITADVAEADFKRIEKGQKVNITVSAAQQLFTTGRINRKNLAASQAMRNMSPKVKFFEVIIDVDSCHSKMKPGLSANCEIILKHEKDTVFVPTFAIFEKDSSKVVYVSEDKEFRPVAVATGSSGASYTIITDGLAGTEVIALSEPPVNLLINGPEKKVRSRIEKN